MRLGRNFDRPRKHNRVRNPTLEKIRVRPLRQLADVVGSTAPENENGRHSISGTYDGPIRLTASLEMSVNHVLESIAIRSRTDCRWIGLWNRAAATLKIVLDNG